MNFTMPLRTISGDNAHKHWRTKARRAKIHRTIARAAFPGPWSKFQDQIGLPHEFALGAGVTITLTRIAPKELDDDGNASGMKSIRDGIADAMGLKSDRDPRVTWRYAQERGRPREYAVRVAISERRRCPTCGGVS